MTLRRAIRRDGELLAECPVDGVCQYIIGNKPGVTCGFFSGTQKSKKGLYVKCKNLLPCTN